MVIKFAENISSRAKLVEYFFEGRSFFSGESFKDQEDVPVPVKSSWLYIQQPHQVLQLHESLSLQIHLALGKSFRQKALSIELPLDFIRPMPTRIQIGPDYPFEGTLKTLEREERVMLWFVDVKSSIAFLSWKLNTFFFDKAG